MRRVVAATLDFVGGDAREVSLLLTDDAEIAAMLADNGQILSCSTPLDGEYSFNQVSLGVPVKMGRNGVQEILELPGIVRFLRFVGFSGEPVGLGGIPVEFHIQQVFCSSI